MAIPSSQILAIWVKEELEPQEWISLRDLCVRAVKRNWTGVSETQLYEFIEQNLPYIAEHLRDEASEWVVDGMAPLYEVDNEPVPYVRFLGESSKEVLAKLRKIDPFKLEEICAQILSKLESEAHATQRTNDGGVDFLGIGLKIVPLALTLPMACKAAVIGQAKRYKDGNVIHETDLREFVGAGVLRRHELQREGKMGPLTPAVFAYWTTSDFDLNAKKYARAVGIWYMDGRTLATYVANLGLKEFVMALPDMTKQA